MAVVSKRFIEGLRAHNLTIAEVNAQGFRYCGGDDDAHLRYFRLLYGWDVATPEHRAHCVCGHDIHYNCYITNGARTLVLGNCCIKRFVDKGHRTCGTCNARHRNRKVNKCNTCRAVCEDCGGVNGSIRFTKCRYCR